ncbi:MAG: tetraacyldisaccharide 4'-kinase, partial [Desulfuromonadales bacterium]|nr:tetraacyldisaccharide 4'-kinase [Desulfuromonadales bacterium]NIS43338.1 tetraacyldisaccharide 4'-kinase [Desulfuromonadales bacterium]
VGNLSVGGTGKTPTVDAVAKHFIGQGRRVAIVSRGYGGSGGVSAQVVSRGEGPVLAP